MMAFLVSAPLRLLRSRGPLTAMKPGSQTARPLGTVDWARGMVQTPVHRWICTKCRRPVNYLNKRQRREWLEKQAHPERGLHVECRGWLPFHRECAGHLVPADAVAS